jgi:phenylacetic acid degradation operon negative regulatory protein
MAMAQMCPSESGPAALTAGVKGLLRYFHRQRPIRGGSLLITVFGDSIAPRGGAVTLGSLIDLARPFALADRLVRTSVGRLAWDGWLIARRDGRRSEYRLTPTGQQRFAEATRRIYGSIPSSWEGQWTLLVLPATTGHRRRNIRDELRWLGFGQVSPGVFAHPNWSIAEARAQLRGLEEAAHGLLFKSSSL